MADDLPIVARAIPVVPVDLDAGRPFLLLPCLLPLLPHLQVLSPVASLVHALLLLLVDAEPQGADGNPSGGAPAVVALLLPRVAHASWVSLAVLSTLGSRSGCYLHHLVRAGGGALGAGAHLQVLPSLLLPGLAFRAGPALLPELPIAADPPCAPRDAAWQAAAVVAPIVAPRVPDLPSNSISVHPAPS